MPVFNKQRFFPFRLKDLIQPKQYSVEEYVKDKTFEEIMSGIIKDIEYPLYYGQPDDNHVYNAYHGKWCHTIEEDYWDTAEEVLGTGIGDCDGSSIAFTTCMRAKGLRPDEVYEVFGVVKDASTGQILGGHGYNIVKIYSKWYLYESTLDEVPEQYPEIREEDIFKPITVGDIVYDGDVFFNDEKEIWIRPFALAGSFNYPRHIEGKYKRISEAWGVKNKGYRKHNILYKLGSKLLRKGKWILDFLFGFGAALVLWEIWDDCIKLGDNPISYQHGYYGLIMMIPSYILIRYSDTIVRKIRG